MRRLSEDCKLTKVADHSTADTAAVTSSSVNMAGYEGVMFLTSFGTANAGNLVKLQQSSDDGATDAFSDIEGTSVSSGSSDEDVYVDLLRPTKQYVRLYATRGSSSTLESIWAIQYGSANKPVDNTTTGTITGEAHADADEGTA